MPSTDVTHVSPQQFRFMVEVADTANRLARSLKQVQRDAATGLADLGLGKSRTSSFGGSPLGPQYVMECERYAGHLHGLTSLAAVMLKGGAIADEDVDAVWLSLIANGSEHGSEWVFDNFRGDRS